MPQKNLSPAQRRARDRAIYALFLRGRSREAIVEEMKTPAAVVRRAIARGEQEAAEQFADPAKVRIFQTEQLKLLFREAFDAWEESKKGHEITKVSSAGADADKRKAEKTTRKQAGDPRFLSQAMSALADLRRLWRLEAPAAGTPSPEPVSLDVEEDARWYGNDAHDLAAQTAAASTPDFALSCTVQGRGLR